VWIKFKYINGMTLLKGIYEEKVQHYFYKYVRKGNVVMDIESNLGLHNI
jgi:hypothetical protein